MSAVFAKVPFAAPLWQYRAFIWSAATREMRLQSMNSVLGWLWPVLNAVALILLYMTLFVEVLKSRLPGSDDSMSYAIYLCIGIINWTYFSNTILRSLNIFGENAMLLKKAGFPKITLPVVVADLPDDVVWVPARSFGRGVLAELASPGSAVTVKGASQ